MFDPWNASFEETMAEVERLTAAGVDEANAFWPMYQAVAAQRVSDQKSLVDKGDGYAVVRAVCACLQYELVAPKWLAVEFLRRAGTVHSYRARSWDDPKAFGRPIPKGKQPAALRTKKQHKIKLLLELNRLLMGDPELVEKLEALIPWPRPKEGEFKVPELGGELLEYLLDRAGETVGVGRTAAHAWYKEFKDAGSLYDWKSALLVGVVWKK